MKHARHRSPAGERASRAGMQAPLHSAEDVPITAANYGTVRASSYSWAAISRVGTQGAQLVGFVLLSRILPPETFGVMAAIGVFIALGQIFTDLGIGPAIVHRKDPSQTFLSTAFWLNAISGVMLTAIIATLGVPLAAWYRMDQLVWLVPLVALTFTLTLSTVTIAVMERQGDFRQLAIMEIVSMVAGYAVGIAVALRWHSVVALAVIPLVNASMLSLLTFFFGRWRASLTFSKDEFTTIRGYIGYLTSFNVAILATRSADDFMIGRVWGPTALGFYSRAYQLMLLPLQQINAGVGRTLQAAFAKARDDREAVARLHERAEFGAAILGWAVAAIVFATAPYAVPAVLGSQWQPAVILLQIMALAIPPQAITGLNGALYTATGNVSLLLKSGLANCAVLLVLLFSSLWFGITWVAVAFTVQAYIAIPIGILPICRRLGIPLGSLPLRFVSLAVAAAAAVAVLRAPVLLLGWEQRPGAAFLLQLAILLLAAAAALPKLAAMRRRARAAAVPSGEPTPAQLQPDDPETTYLLGERL